MLYREKILRIEKEYQSLELKNRNKRTDFVNNRKKIKSAFETQNKSVTKKINMYR